MGSAAAAALRPGASGPHPDEDHLGISLADFGHIRSRAIVGKGCIGWGRVS
jgi:hypothetical protein